MGESLGGVVSWALSQDVIMTQWALPEWNPLKVPKTQKMPLELTRRGDRRRGPELTRPFLPLIAWPLAASGSRRDRESQIPGTLGSEDKAAAEGGADAGHEA